MISRKEVDSVRIITISREFGSGGRELGKRLAEIMGFDYYDREIITAIADSSGLDANYVENALETGIWQRVPLTFHNSFASKAVFQASHINLLSEQTKVIEGIAKAGHDCVIVGRNADVLLAKENPFTIFVCADLEAKVRRCMERAPENEQLTRKELEQNIRRVDKNRAQTHEILTGSKWGQGSTYHLTVNTSSWDIKKLAPAVAEIASRWFEQREG